MYIKAKRLSVTKYQVNEGHICPLTRAAVLASTPTPVGKLAAVLGEISAFGNCSVWSRASWLMLASARTGPHSLCYDMCSSVLSHARNLGAGMCTPFTQELASVNDE